MINFKFINMFLSKETLITASTILKPNYLSFFVYANFSIMLNISIDIWNSKNVPISYWVWTSDCYSGFQSTNALQVVSTIISLLAKYCRIVFHLEWMVNSSCGQGDKTTIQNFSTINPVCMRFFALTKNGLRTHCNVAHEKNTVF